MFRAQQAGRSAYSQRPVQARSAERRTDQKLVDVLSEFHKSRRSVLDFQICADESRTACSRYDKRMRPHHLGKS